jgi:hypothetical protein
MQAGAAGRKKIREFKKARHAGFSWITSGVSWGEK